MSLFIKCTLRWQIWTNKKLLLVLLLCKALANFWRAIWQTNRRFSANCLMCVHTLLCFSFVSCAKSKKESISLLSSTRPIRCSKLSTHVRLFFDVSPPLFYSCLWNWTFSFSSFSFFAQVQAYTQTFIWLLQQN